MKLSEEVVAVLDAARCEGNKLFLAGSPFHIPETPRLERGLYLEVNKALKALGGTWDRKSQAHVFEENIADAISDAVVSGDVEDRKKALGFFETPIHVAKRLVDLAHVQPGQTVLEPSAGKGAIVDAISADVFLTMIEIDPANAKHLTRFKASRIICRDFLKCAPASGRDRIIANPPFARQQDIDHCLHMHKFLSFGGVLVSVMSAGVLFRQDKKTTAFREFVRLQSGHFERLPEGSFKSSGTMVSTCIVKIPRSM